MTVYVVSSGQTSSGTVLNTGDTQNVYGTASGTVVNAGGIENVYADGVANGTVVNGGGIEVVSAGGVASGGVVTTYGFEAVNLGGVASGGVVDGRVYVASGGVLSGAALGDGTIDLAGIGLATAATLGSGNVLTVSGGSGGPVTLQLDPTENFAGLAFQLGSDDHGGTDLSVVPALPPTITGTVAGQQTTDAAAVKPFAAVTIGDTNPGSPTETVTVTPSSTANGTLSDPSQATDGSTISTGAITLTGSASAVTTELDGLVFTPTPHQVAPGQSVTTTFLISDTNSDKLTATDDTTSVVATAAAPPAPTAAQLKQVGKDLLQFYTDTLLHRSTTADVTKLASDFTALDLSQAELGQLLGQTLASATLGSTAATALGNDIAAKYYPKITSGLAHGGQTLPTDLTALLATTVGAGADDLLRTHTGQGATAALAATVQDFKLA